MTSVSSGWSASGAGPVVSIRETQTPCLPGSSVIKAVLKHAAGLGAQRVRISLAHSVSQVLHL